MFQSTSVAKKSQPLRPSGHSDVSVSKSADASNVGAAAAASASATNGSETTAISAPAPTPTRLTFKTLTSAAMPTSARRRTVPTKVGLRAKGVCGGEREELRAEELRGESRGAAHCSRHHSCIDGWSIGSTARWR